MIVVVTPLSGDCGGDSSVWLLWWWLLTMVASPSSYGGDYYGIRWLDLLLSGSSSSMNTKWLDDSDIDPEENVLLNYSVSSDGLCYWESNEENSDEAKDEPDSEHE